MRETKKTEMELVEEVASLRKQLSALQRSDSKRAQTEAELRRNLEELTDFVENG